MIPVDPAGHYDFQGNAIDFSRTNTVALNIPEGKNDSYW
jgi:hypothetical protein